MQKRQGWGARKGEDCEERAWRDGWRSSTVDGLRLIWLLLLLLALLSERITEQPI